MAHKDRLKALIALGFGAFALLAATTPVAAHKGHHCEHKRVEAVEERDEVVEEDADVANEDDDDDDDDARKVRMGGRSDRYGNPTYTTVREESDEEDDDDGVLGIGDDKPGVLGIGEDDDDDGN